MIGFSLGSIEGKPGIHAVYKSIEHHGKHDKAKPGKDLEIALYQIIAQVPKPVQIDLLDK